MSTRLGVLGAGKVFALYERAVADLPDVQIVAVVDPDPAKRARANETGRLAFARAEDLLRLPLDGILVLAPNAWHASLVRRCLEAGFPTLCEKPLATTPEEAEELLGLAAAGGGLLYAAMHCRHRPEVRYVRDRLTGDVVAFRQTYREDWTRAPAWYRDPRRSGGGVLLDVGINQVDWLLPIVGSLAVESATALPDRTPVELDCRVRWTFPTGRGEADYSWREHRQRKATRLITEAGETFELDHAEHSVVHDGRRHGPWRNEEYADVLREFLACARGTARPQPPTAPEVLRLLREAYRAAGRHFLSGTEEGRAARRPAGDGG